MRRKGTAQLVLRQINIMAIVAVATFVPATGIIGSAATESTASSNFPDKLALGEGQIKQLLLLMDTDKDGKVSKQQYMKFMEAEFEKLDKDKSGYLNAKKLTRPVAIGSPARSLSIHAGHVPAHGPAPASQSSAVGGDQQQGPPRVLADDRWVGHDTGRNDPRYHLVEPWRHGHFPGGIGAGHLWQLAGGSPYRFWFGAYFASVAPADRSACADWNWNGDQIALYDDPDHVGWYLAYNVRLGTFAHIIYLGA